MNHSFQLIPLTIEARGEVISSNIEEFRELIREALGMIHRDLQTDEEFGQAEMDAKALKGAEDSVKAAKEKALADAESLHALFTTLDATSEEIRSARLDLEKQISKRKEEIKAELIEESLATFTALDIEPGLARKHYLSGLQAAIKGKRTLDGMKTALRIHASTQQGIIGKCRAILDRFEETHGPELTMDRRTLELETPQGVEAELRRRFEAKRAAAEKKRLEAAAAAARAEAQAAIRQAEAARPVTKLTPLPDPPKIGSIPTGAKAAAPGRSTRVPFHADSPFMDPMNDEWEAFKTAVFTSFGPLKAAKDALRHAENQQRASLFASAVNAAWQAANALEVAS